MKKLLQVFLLLCLTLGAALPVTAADRAAIMQDKDKIWRDYTRAYFTSIAAAACVGVYVPDSSSEFSYLRDYGWEIAPHRQVDGKVETNFAVARNYFAAVGKEIYLVSFRGSASKADWDINFKTRQVPFGGAAIGEMESIAKGAADKDTPAVHEGYNAYVNAVLRSSVVDAAGHLTGVFKRVASAPDTFMVLTGHSLGGAAATLLGERLVALGLPKSKFIIITFGAPAIGNAAFAERYGDAVDLLRITNTADPVPGSLQTFFGGYKQFGENYKYHLSPKISNFQHDMAMYFDNSISEFFKAEDSAVAAGVVRSVPYSKVVAGKPLVALWITSSPGLARHKYVPDIKRFITDEYRRSLPSYVVMDKAVNVDRLPEREDIMKLSREAGAEYVLLCGIDGKQVRAGDYWYIALDQALFTADGRMLTMGTFAKKVDPAAGNIQAAGANLLQARSALIPHLPVITKHEYSFERQ